MKASKNSIHAKLYNFTYSDGWLPNNLCPYFWKLVGAVIIFVPNLIIQIPGIIYNLVTKGDENCGERRVIGIGMYFLIMIVSGFIYLNYHWIRAILGYYSYDYTSANIGCIIDMTALSVYIGWLISKKRNVEESKPNIIIEFVKAKYNNYCPKIDWE